ncbi:MAG TPA: hypothetical protein ENH82_16585 [bacterium]|nr:hypothetical protein [bacterium]
MTTTTLKQIAEQISRLYIKANKDKENVKPNMEPKELYPLILQEINGLLSIVPLDKRGILSGSQIPDCMIATYANKAVSATAGNIRADLPAYPVHLPMGAGLFAVYLTGVQYTSSQFIPMSNSMWSLVGANAFSTNNKLEGKIGFWMVGDKIHFTVAPSANVDIQLLIVDPAVLTDTDPLPVTADMESAIIKTVLELLMNVGQVVPQEEK